MSVFSRHGKEALTRWKVVERFGVMALLDVAIETGRTHQIRVHLNSIGHPILGDEVYGNSSRRLQAVRDTTLLSMLRGMRRQALHARGWVFTIPLRTGTFGLSLPSRRTCRGSSHTCGSILAAPTGWRIDRQHVSAFEARPSLLPGIATTEGKPIPDPRIPDPMERCEHREVFQLEPRPA